MEKSKKRVLFICTPSCYQEKLYAFFELKILACHISYVHKQGVIFVYMSRSKNTGVACYTLEGQLVKTYQSAKQI